MMLLLQLDDIDISDVYNIHCCKMFLVLTRKFRHCSRKK